MFLKYIFDDFTNAIMILTKCSHSGQHSGPEPEQKLSTSPDTKINLSREISIRARVKRVDCKYIVQFLICYANTFIFRW